MRRTRTGSLLLTLGLGALLQDCQTPRDPTRAEDPGRVALQLFALARAGDPASGSTSALFGATTAAARPPGLPDALSALGRFPAPVVLGVTALGDTGEVHVDLECTLVGGGAARFTVHLVREAQVWQVRWFQGPGVEWPAPGKSVDESLTTSSHLALPAR